MEARLLESVFPTDTNPQGTLFGGTLVSWMDKAAGFAAMRRARTTVVTAAIENISFGVPIRVGDLVEVTATVTSVGRTSMRVLVEVRRENPIRGQSELCTHGNFTMVAMDAERHPTPVPPE
ncbi:MAG TPA: acyl-CoA thioesterase [Miltoncostaeaceae bacterium]|nr:acyl-CoA thioesterase [Miltoncostaeaceae bacterium]